MWEHVRVCVRVLKINSKKTIRLWKGQRHHTKADKCPGKNYEQTRAQHSFPAEKLGTIERAVAMQEHQDFRASLDDAVKVCLKKSTPQQN